MIIDMAIFGDFMMYYFAAMFEKLFMHDVDL